MSSRGRAAITPDVVYGHEDGMFLTFDGFRDPNANGAAILYMVRLDANHLGVDGGSAGGRLSLMLGTGH